MHCHGWRSVYCIPERPAFKGSAPINLSDRLNQVLRWALGSVEIFLSRHCPIWYGYGGGLKWLERFSYINSVVYPWTSIPLLVYCSLPAICLLTGKFIVPEVISFSFSYKVFKTRLLGRVECFVFFPNRCGISQSTSLRGPASSLALITFSNQCGTPQFTPPSWLSVLAGTSSRVHSLRVSHHQCRALIPFVTAQTHR